MPDRDAKVSWKNKLPTRKQMDYIKHLSDECGVEFTGTTRGEACDYISQHTECPGYDDRSTEHEEPYWAMEAIFDSMWGGIDQY